ncbi:hypothetical protein BDD14_5196 [Edaphobacter modestus]|uniref:Uncharacterized protein n=1 Tax=Edaphobacter modestus TaxID=388466 RepID=A0A4Q7Z002_9BACT|nr:hypothetical protein BDD14_5196 [Edaphobacter modestus]
MSLHRDRTYRVHKDFSTNRIDPFSLFIRYNRQEDTVRVSHTAQLYEFGNEDGETGGEFRSLLTRSPQFALPACQLRERRKQLK